MPYDKNVMAANLRGLRAKKRMTQAEVAEAVGISSATVQNYENGVGSVSYEVAWSLADLFGIPICDLGGRDERRFAS
jgi:transcriptional regulator with XRE-family HTH domain